jgi:hypothetical protein
MSDKTATLHLTDVSGFAGPTHLTRCYKLDPPKEFDHYTHEYVTVWIDPPAKHKDGEVVVVEADETGAIAAPTVKRRAGSFTLEGVPATPDYVEGCFVWALAGAGYRIVTE